MWSLDPYLSKMSIFAKKQLENEIYASIVAVILDLNDTSFSLATDIYNVWKW